MKANLEQMPVESKTFVTEEREPNNIGSMSVNDHARTLLRLERF